MMAGAKRELRDAVEELPESDAELVLSFIHCLRAFERDPSSEATEEGILGDLARDLLLLRALGSSDLDVSSLRQRHRSEGEEAWLGLADDVLARDWDRAEEDEAWSHL